jgi:hypothetical protein
VRAYVVRWQEREHSEQGRTRVDVFFDHRPERAMYRKTRKQAEDDCALLESLRVAVPSCEGGTHICREFSIEERTPTRFVIFCDGPFVCPVLV